MSHQDDMLLLIAKYQLFEGVLWHQNKEGGFDFTVACSDFFWWETADFEEVDEKTFPELEQALSDKMEAASGPMHHGALLYCARRRKMRPQGYYYKYLVPETHVLFDACGPEREMDEMNPHDQKEFAA